MCYMLKKNIYPAFTSKKKSNREKPINLVMISNGEGWHYLAVARLSALMGEITSTQNNDFYCLNRFSLFRTKNKQSHKKIINITLFVVLKCLLKKL